MTNIGSTGGKAGSGSIDCLLKRFEALMDADGVFKRSSQQSVQSGSLRGQRNIIKTVDPKAVASTVGRSNASRKGGNVTTAATASEAAEPSVQSSSSSSDRSLSASFVIGERKNQVQSEQMKITGSNSSHSGQTTAAEGNAVSRNPMEQNDGLVSSKSPPSALIDSSPVPPKDSKSTLDGVNLTLTSAHDCKENGCHSEHKCTSVSENDRCDSPRVPIRNHNNLGSNVTPVVMRDFKMAERNEIKERERGNATRTRYVFKQSSNEKQNASLYSDDVSSSASNKVKQLAKSMENLYNNSASTPTKEVSVFHVQKAVGNETWIHQTPSTAPAVFSSSTNSDKTSVSRAKKPPPPVPKKNFKVTRDLSSASDQSHVTSHLAECQTTTDQTTKPARPTSLFPGYPVVGDNDDDANDDDNNDDICKSLSILEIDADREVKLLPVGSKKDTLMPTNRQRNRSGIMSKETRNSDDRLNSTCDYDDFNPVFPFRNSIELLDSPFLSSPMSLGARTLLPDTDSLTDCQANVRRLSGSNLSPMDQSSTEDAFVEFFSDAQTPTTKATARTGPASDLIEDFDSESFLSDVFDFLGSSNTAENETKFSPLKSWTDTWNGIAKEHLGRNSYEESVEIAYGSIENRPNEENRKELSGVSPDKKKSRDEKVIRSENLPNADMKKETTGKIRFSGADEKMKAERDPSTASICSAPPLTFLPSQRPKTGGKSIGGRALFLLDGSASVSDPPATETGQGHGTEEATTIMDELEAQLNVINRAFNFLDDSGA